MGKVSKESLAKAAKRLRPVFKALTPEGAKYAAIPALIEGFPGTVEAYYEEEAFDPYDDELGEATLFGFTLLIAEALGETRKATVVEGDLDFAEAEAYCTVYSGDLIVKGNLWFNSVLVVLGDLIVDGVLADSEQWSTLWVTGTVRAKAAQIGARVWVGGRCTAELVLLSRWGTLYAHGGTETNVALRNDYDGEGFRGSLSARHNLDWERDKKAFIAALRPNFVDKKGAFDENRLVDAVMKGQPIIR